MATTHRVVQWTSGKVARKALLAVLAHPELELVGLYAHSPDKVGKDASLLCGTTPVGIAATADVAALLALKPDCVLYNPLYPDVAELCRILGVGCQRGHDVGVHHRLELRRGRARPHRGRGAPG